MKLTDWSEILIIWVNTMKVLLEIEKPIDNLLELSNGLILRKIIDLITKKNPQRKVSHLDDKELIETYLKKEFPKCQPFNLENKKDLIIITSCFMYVSSVTYDIPDVKKELLELNDDLQWLITTFFKILLETSNLEITQENVEIAITNIPDCDVKSMKPPIKLTTAGPSSSSSPINEWFQSPFVQEKIMLKKNELIRTLEKTLDEAEEKQNEKTEILKTEMEAKNTEMEAMKTEIEAMKTEMEAMKTEMEAMKTEMEAKNTEMEAKKTEMEAKKTEMEAKFLRLEEENKPIKTSRGTIQNLTDLQNQELEILQKKYEHLASEMKEKLSAASIEFAKAENESLYKQVVEMQEKNVELQKRFYDVELNLKRVIQEQEVMISTLTETNKQILEKCRKTKLQLLAIYEGMNSEESVIQEEDSSKKITHLESSSQEIDRIISTLVSTVQKLPDALCNLKTEVTSKTKETYDKKVKKMKKRICEKFDAHLAQYAKDMDKKNKLQDQEKEMSKPTCSSQLPEKSKDDIQEGLAEGDGDSLLSGTTGRLRPQVQDGFEVN